MNILVTGSSGMLGKDLVEILSATQDINVFGIDKKENTNFKGRHQIIGDLLNEDFLNESLSKINPDIIIHCAAFVNLDFCESNKEITERLHCKTTGKLAAYNSGRARFIYISTDSVFNGEKGNYEENDSTRPLNFYAQSKLYGEKISQKENPKTLILRTNIYGFNRPEGNSLIEWALNNFEKGESIYGFQDIIFNPLYTKQLARIVHYFVIHRKLKGIIHAGSDTCISKYQFLFELAKVFTYSSDLVIRSDSDVVSLKTPRPKNTCLKLNKLKKIGPAIPSLRDGLKELCNDFIK